MAEKLGTGTIFPSVTRRRKWCLSLFFLFFIIFLVLVLPVYCNDEPDPRDSGSAYGVLDFLIWDHEWNYNHYDTKQKIERSVEMMHDAGIGFVRMDFLWEDIEPAPGKFDFTKYDMIVDIVRKKGISILGILHYNPSWDQGPWNKAPNIKLYTKYACATVEHFKDRVKYWEIWNEPDEPEYWMPQDDMKTYTALLRKVYCAIKEIDPTCKVLMGGISNKIQYSLKRMYENGAKDYFDIVNIHPFGNPLEEDAIEKIYYMHKVVRDVMEKYGDSEKRIWFTEIGCPGVEVPKKRLGWWFGEGPDEQVQAKWVDLIYSNCLKWQGVEKVFWAFFRDTDCHFKSAVDYFGLIRNDFSEKPSYKAYKDIAKK
jgi:polysaccharide biosynthesis protein PslG